MLQNAMHVKSCEHVSILMLPHYHDFRLEQLTAQQLLASTTWLLRAAAAVVVPCRVSQVETRNGDSLLAVAATRAAVDFAFLFSSSAETKITLLTLNGWPME